MRNTIVNNGWNTTEWGLAFLRVASFPLDPSLVFESKDEFNVYLSGQDTDKPYVGQLVAVKNDDAVLNKTEEDGKENFTVYLINSTTGTGDSMKWNAIVLNGDALDNLNTQLDEFKKQITQDLDDLYTRIKNGASDQFDTFKEIEDYLRNLDANTSTNIKNLQRELGDTQYGIGLNQNGQFAPDQATTYLKQATSVMNALHILDGLIKKTIVSNFAIKNLTISKPTAYIGETVDVVLNWDYAGLLQGDNPDSLEINGQKVDVTARTFTFKGVTANTTYTFSATYQGSTSTASISIVFNQPAKVGVVDGDVNEEVLNSLANYSGNPTRLDCSGGKYYVVCALHGANITPLINNLPLLDTTTSTVGDYDVYKSNNKYNGIIIADII